jgi:hypothetical protein
MPMVGPAQWKMMYSGSSVAEQMLQRCVGGAKRDGNCGLQRTYLGHLLLQEVCLNP